MQQITVTPTDPSLYGQQTVTSVDSSLIANFQKNTTFNTESDTVELYLYTNNLLTGYDYNFTEWKLQNTDVVPGTLETSEITLNPEYDSARVGILDGTVTVVYKFVTNRLGTSNDTPLYLNTISPSRTEIGLKSNNLTAVELQVQVADFIQTLNSAETFEGFYVNFGNNIQVLAVNIQYSVDANEIYIKLYEPLPNSIPQKNTCWVQTEVGESVAYNVVYKNTVEVVENLTPLRSPNYNIPLASSVNSSTDYLDYTALTATRVTGSFNQLNSLLSESGSVEINVDYSNFNNFVHFSSATRRLENFYYKASLLENYQNLINELTASSGPTVNVNADIVVLENAVNTLITNFDGYEYYLYFESGSTSWPKTNSIPPYTLASTGSAAVLSWYGTAGIDGSGILQSASIYDNENQDNLVYSIPEFIREDSDNNPGELFVEMLGQHFDNLYLYTQAITQKYNADNRLDYGVSKDLVADTLRSFGVKLYENNF